MLKNTLLLRREQCLLKSVSSESKVQRWQRCWQLNVEYVRVSQVALVLKACSGTSKAGEARHPEKPGKAVRKDVASWITNPRIKDNIEKS